MKKNHARDTASLEHRPGEDTAETVVPRTIAFSGERLRQLREKRGLSALELATAASITQRHIWRLEANKRPNTAAITLGRLALVLDTSLEYLLNMTDDPAPPAWAADIEAPTIPVYESRRKQAQRERREKLLEFFRDHPRATYKDAAVKLGAPLATISQDITSLKRVDRLRRQPDTGVMLVPVGDEDESADRRSGQGVGEESPGG